MIKFDDPNQNYEELINTIGGYRYSDADIPGVKKLFQYNPTISDAYMIALVFKKTMPFEKEAQYINRHLNGIVLDAAQYHKLYGLVAIPYINSLIAKDQKYLKLLPDTVKDMFLF